MKRLLLVVTLVFSIPLSAADKLWQKGTLLSYDQNTFTTYSQQNGTGRDTPHTTYKVQIDTGEKILFAERTLNWRWQKFPKVTENGPVSWAPKGEKEIFLKDDQGKEFTLDIVKTRLK